MSSGLENEHPFESPRTLEGARSPRRRRRFWLWFALGAGASLTLVILVIASAVPFSSEILRERIVASLSERLDSEVELSGLQLRLLPQFHVEGYGLRIRHKGRRDLAPLIKADTLTIDAGFAGLLRKHVSSVTLTGLEINIPPGQDDNGEQPDLKNSEAKDDAKDVVVDRLFATDARLIIIPDDRHKPSRTWAIHQLEIQSVSYGHAMPFDATLTNAIPPGEIRTRGSFGPWQPETPGATSLEGTFVFSDADLGVFKGISGILNAHGEFGGSLGRIGVHGETNTPQFTVSVGGHPVPLHTDYHATVDGTNGNTLLDRIDASFLNTSLVARGSIVGTPGKDGRTVSLDIVMDKARIEDVLRLAVKAPKAPMIGAMKLKTRFVLPPGDRDVVEKLQLDGRFDIASVTFTNIDIQRKVDELSRRSRGNTADAGQSSVVSNFGGQFKLGGGSLALPALTFDTPGAHVRLAGTYKLRPELLDFKGTLLMDAKLSETQKGWKRLLLKVVDPLFANKGGHGSAVPIRIEGRRDNPSFGLDTHALFRRGK